MLITQIVQHATLSVSFAKPLEATLLGYIQATQGFPADRATSASLVLFKEEDQAHTCFIITEPAAFQ